MKKSISQTDIRNNLKRLITNNSSPSHREIERKTVRYGKVTSTTLGNFINRPEARSPLLKTIMILSKVLNIQPWVLLIKDAPISTAINNPIESISEEGYLLLKAFEDAPDNVKYSILDSVSHSIIKSNPKASDQIKETQAKYFI